MAALGLLVLRLALGLTMLAHGVSLARGLPRSRGTMERLGLRPAGLWTLVNCGGQLAGGALVTLGLLTPVGAALLVGVAVIVVLMKRPKGFWSHQDGWEYGLILAAAASTLCFAGAGAYSLDALLGTGLAPLAGTAWAVAVLVAAAAWMTRRAPVASGSTR